ncbi:hypothetical protein [uncultured Leifsonia sp.]|uniref:hypothetical protein n=1 Tax=uncultured Leifsonia sp. TaxID=340359 RepID=UPI0025EE80DC|nr:hypothetical protein [uncultured Leifsonia sp.]
MRVETAMLPEARSSQDRIFVTPSAVIMLDGATAFVPAPVTPDQYVDTLGGHLVESLTTQPAIELTAALADGIAQTARELELEAGRSPSSTVAIVRQRDQSVDFLVLGDTQLVTPTAIVLDDRIAEVATIERVRYRERLASGGGFDQRHRQYLRELQAKQAEYRNRDGGYWIAEADPRAATRAAVGAFAINSGHWAVLATDGVYRPMVRLGLDYWESVSAHNSETLTQLLAYLDGWEADVDPDGVHLPRAKRHDDKAIAAITF